MPALPFTPRHSRRPAQRGFSLVELMVALTLSMILMAGVLSIFFSSKVTFFANEKTARLQESGRIALDLMVHDIRSAGYQGCAKQTPISTLNTGTALWNYSLPVMGFESNGSGSYTPALSTLGYTLTPAPANDSDVLVVRMLLRDGDALITQDDLAATNSGIPVLNSTPPPVSAGQVMMITDCNASSIFEVTGWTAGSPNGLIQHAATGSTPGNATDNLDYMYLAGARVLPFQTVIYWVGDTGTPSGPALYRRMGTQDPQILIEGIQALQVAYGVDTNADRVVDSYTAATSTLNWDNVISVSLALLAQSDATGTDIDRGAYPMLTPSNATLGGKTLGPYNDRRQRMLFTTTAVVRNRAL